MPREPEAGGWPLEPYWNYLYVLARARLGKWSQGHLDPSDVVQETLRKVWQRREQVRAVTEAQWLTYLRQVLATTLIDMVRKCHSPAARSLADGLEQSSQNLESWLAGEQTSPSQQAMRQELLGRVADALARLPKDQRTALELRYLQQPRWSLAEIAGHLGRTEKAAAGLLYRGLEALRESLTDGA
jgi:RNA polymerase sigma-70 factor (ECF subfamily)